MRAIDSAHPILRNFITLICEENKLWRSAILYLKLYHSHRRAEWLKSTGNVLMVQELFAPFFFKFTPGLTTKAYWMKCALRFLCNFCCKEFYVQQIQQFSLRCIQPCVYLYVASVLMSHFNSNYNESPKFSKIFRKFSPNFREVLLRDSHAKGQNCDNF